MKIANVLKSPLSILAIAALFFSGVYILADGNKSPPKIVNLYKVPVTAAAEQITAPDKKIKKLKVTIKNTVFVLDEIGQNAAGIANEINLRSNNSEPTLVLINSPGGSVLDGALIVSAIEASKTPVYTICVQFCASMAAIIEGYGDKRYMVDRSILMHHQAAGGVNGTIGQMHSRLNTLTRYVYKMDSGVAAKAGMTLDAFLQMQVNEVWIDAEDAVNMKLSDGLVSLDLSELDKTNISSQLRASTALINQRFNIRLSDF